MENKLLPKVFLWMAAGLLITFITGYAITLSESMLTAIYTNGFYWVFAILEFVLVIVLSARVFKMKPNTAKFFFLLYSFVSGLTFSSIFVVYEISSILNIFLIAAALFGIFGFIGYKTEMDLSKVGLYCMMGLFALIICMLINIFVASETFNIAISALVIIVFFGITAYDMQKIKRIAYDNDSIPEENLAIYGALELYLDYINIFLHLLSLFAKENN